MATTKKRTYYLENLGCANCAAKMEVKLNKMSEVESATINFVHKKLILELKQDSNELDELSFLDEIIKNVTSIESHVIVKPLDTDTIDTIDKIDTPKAATQKNENQIDASRCELNGGCDNSSSASHTHIMDRKEEKEAKACNDGCCTGKSPQVKHSHEHSNSNQSTHNHEHSHSNHTGKNYTKLLRQFLGFGISMLAIKLELGNPLGIIIILFGYFLLGFDVLYNSYRGIRSGEIFDENFLVVVATLGALIIGEYPEGIAVMFLFQIGEFLQDLAVDNSRKQLESVMNIKPEYANLQTNEGIKTVAPDMVQIDDIIIVKPSEKIPLDGVVVDGSSFIDTSSLTGESVPRKVKAGDSILSGCLNGSGTIFIKVSKTYKNSTVSKVLDLVENASSKKSKTENFITKFARIYTPIVVLCAILLSVIPPIVTGTYDFSTWIYRACGFLVVSCPCALVISIPLGFFGGIGCASKNGILVKGSNYLEALNFAQTAVFDKTGTLTKGIFSVSEINTIEGYSDQELLRIAATVESFSNHPIAKSIVNAYKDSVDTSLLSNYEEISGHGVSATLSNDVILIGNTKLLDKFNISYHQTNSNPLGTTAYIAVNGVYVGNIIISDDIKDDSSLAIKSLKKMGIQTIMLTGDVESTAKLVADKLGIDSVYSELLPTDKVDKVESLIEKKSAGRTILFVGDGMNDAPVLARADVGIAMGGVGSDAAIEAADIVIMTDEPSKIATAIKIAKHTRKIVIQNIILALGVKFIVLLLLAIGYGSMWLAVFADGGVALIAIFNSIRALNYKEQIHE